MGSRESCEELEKFSKNLKNQFRPGFSIFGSFNENFVIFQKLSKMCSNFSQNFGNKFRIFREMHL